MKRLILIMLAVSIAVVASAEDTTEQTPKKKKAKDTKTEQVEEKEEITKTGYNFGPLPAVAFDADKGFQLGALLNIYNYGDGSTYPNPMSHTYMEASWFTKGSMQVIF